jgi:hypothetical protein
VSGKYSKKTSWRQDIRRVGHHDSGVVLTMVVGVSGFGGRAARRESCPTVSGVDHFVFDGGVSKPLGDIDEHIPGDGVPSVDQTPRVVRIESDDSW